MILLLPIGLLLTSALAIIIIDQYRPKFGTSWLIASLASIAAWLVIFFLRLRLPTTLEVLSWQSSDLNLPGHFSLLLDYQSWPYVFALITITLAVILSDAARTRYDTTPQSWSISLVITALSFFALQSGSSLTLMVTWVVIDLVELIYLLQLKDSQPFLTRIVISYGVRIASIVMLVLATSQAWRTSGQFDLTDIPQSGALLFLVAVGLRLGVFPLNLPFLQEPTLRRGAGNIIRLSPVAASLTLLARLPTNLVPATLSGWKPVMEGMLSVAALYAAFRWFSASDEIEGRPFWIVAWSAFATVSVLNDSPDASLAWGMAVLLPGSLLFLYEPRVQRMNFLLYFGLVGIIGLPFTPAASGWTGLVADGVSVWTFLFVIAHVVIVLGYFNHVRRPGGEPGALEAWARLVYPLSLVIIIQALAAVGLIGWPDSLTPGVWWLSLISILLIITSVLLIKHYKISPPYFEFPKTGWLAKGLNWIFPRLEVFFRLEWFYWLIWKINRVIGWLLKSFSKILESDGGILWTLLLFILIITILSGGGPN